MTAIVAPWSAAPCVRRYAWTWTLVIGLLAGCVEDHLVVCMDGRACAVDLVCDEAHHGCVTPDQIAKCIGAAEQTACQPGFKCFDGVCLPAGCGNGFVEAEELCDDGNTLAGDGCSPTCASREACGDGVVEVALGEQCDDGARSGFDGCSSSCRFEELTWSRRLAAVPPRLFPTVAYDLHRRRLVVFGGGEPIQGPVMNDTWEWDGIGWTEVRLLFSPPPRTGHAMAYDPVRHRIVMFGGASSFLSVSNDTWEWDGIAWDRKVPVGPPPPARVGHAMAWDPVRAQIVMFGGRSFPAAPTSYGDSWAWNGAAWTKLATSAAPSRRTGAAMVEDPVGNRIVLFGGSDGGTALTDTWILDGAGWSQLPTPQVPTALNYPTMAFDAAQGTIVLVVSDDAHGETWNLQSQTWQRLVDAPNHRGALAYDVALGGVVGFGGTNAAGVANSALDAKTGIAWQRVAPSPAIEARSGAPLVYDVSRSRVVMFGGVASSFGSLPVWYDSLREWDGRSWSAPIAPAVRPSKRAEHATAYHAATDTLVVFGGTDESTVVVGDTWLWHQGAWRAVTGALAPPPRTGSSAVYDVARKRVLMFGGKSASGALLADLWAWDGAAWTELQQGTAPPPRYQHALAYDPIRDRVIVFGGAGGALLLGDTWEWDGAAWTEGTSASGAAPEPQSGSVLVFDQARKHSMLVGGSLPWEWDGSSWTQPSELINPGARGLPGATYDWANAELVMFGGGVFLATTNDIWTARFRSADDEACSSGIDRDGDGLIGCADDDCAGRCEPACVRGLSCDPTLPRCGDAICGDVENDRLCPMDPCQTTSVCGDGWCAAGEVCAGDC